MEKRFWHSKKFWAAMFATALPVANFCFSWGMAPEHITSIVAPVMAYILGQGLADLGKNKG